MLLGLLTRKSLAPTAASTTTCLRAWAGLHPTTGVHKTAQPDRLDDTLQDLLDATLEDIRKAGTWKNERVLEGPQSACIRVAGSSQPVLNFCANNYLGLSNHPKLAEAAIDAIRTHGYGLSSVRFICGTQDLHKRLEQAISAFHGTEDTILFPSCFDANAGLFEALLGPEDAVLSDELNHASIIDGIRLCKAKRLRYKHMDMADLESKLKEAAGARLRLIATDGVFSMDGHIAPLADITALARRHQAYVFVDECHATGVLGATGRGTDEHCGVMGQVDIINSTLGKALGGATGGYTTGRASLVALLRQRARPYLFSNTLAPAVAGASLAVFELLTHSSEPLRRLADNTAYFRTRMTDLGFDIRPGSHPIVPVMLGDAALASRMADELLKRGIYVIGFSYPVVPKGLARIRVQISAAHECAHLDAAVAAFEEVGRELGVISASNSTSGGKVGPGAPREPVASAPSTSEPAAASESSTAPHVGLTHAHADSSTAGPLGSASGSDRGQARSAGVNSSSSSSSPKAQAAGVFDNAHVCPISAPHRAVPDLAYRY